ncbi:MAG: hypothetical protein KC422_25315, partial [Trueperaceae bacterium]|nr:hypothetical protein [Trueperaceae bacterium]
MFDLYLRLIQVTRISLSLLLAISFFYLSSGNAQNPWETPSGPACFERWIKTSSALLNSYQGTPDFNSRKPWSFNQYGLIEGGTEAGPKSVYAPDTWAQYGNNKYAYMWIELYRFDDAYPYWANADWQGAGISGLRYFVLQCLADNASTVVPTLPSSPSLPNLSSLTDFDSTASCPSSFSYTGSTLTIICYCSPEAIEGSLWGTSVYTSDSSICKAAQHTGVLAPSGGMVIVKGAPGQSSYAASTQYGISSSSYGSYGWSFYFPGSLASSAPTPPGPTTPSIPSQPSAETEECPATFSGYRETTEILACSCSSQTTESGTLWGTTIYTDDSTICRAAVHAGVLTERGGIVYVQAKPGQDSYLSTSQNGITSSSYSAWGGSFSFVAASQVVYEDIFVQLGPPVLISFPDSSTQGWTLNYGELRNSDGYIGTDAPSEGVTSYYIAPSGFHGNWTGYRQLSFDLFSTGGSYYSDLEAGGYGDVFLVNGEMIAHRSISNPHDDQWHTFNIPLYDDGLWVFGGGATSLEMVLSNITNFQI